MDVAPTVDMLATCVMDTSYLQWIELEDYLHVSDTSSLFNVGVLLCQEAGAICLAMDGCLLEFSSMQDS